MIFRLLYFVPLYTNLRARSSDVFVSYTFGPPNSNCNQLACRIRLALFIHFSLFGRKPNINTTRLTVWTGWILCIVLYIDIGLVICRMNDQRNIASVLTPSKWEAKLSIPHCYIETSKVPAFVYSKFRPQTSLCYFNFSLYIRIVYYSTNEAAIVATNDQTLARAPSLPSFHFLHPHTYSERRISLVKSKGKQSKRPDHQQKEHSISRTPRSKSGCADVN